MLATNPSFLRQAQEAIEDLDREPTADGVIDVMQRTVGHLGFEFFCACALPGPNQRFEDVVLTWRVPAEWGQLYLDQQYALIDPAIDYCKKAAAPFVWKDVPYDAERQPRVAEFIQRVTDFGLENGLCFPIPGQQDAIGAVWMGGPAADLARCNLPLLHLISLYAFERLVKLRGVVENHQPLTIREREVLTWIAQGKSAWEIGEILGIAKRTVDEHSQTACRKLNAVNRTQAVVVALRDRLIAA